jgi:hypothetical protein
MMLGNMQDDISDIELKQRWRLYWIESIFEFSNPKLQRMSWLEGPTADWPNGEEWPSSFDACMSAYFDNLALDDGYAKAVLWGNVSQEEAQGAEAFTRLAYAYIEPDEDPQEILDDTQWMEVVASAKEFWGYLKRSVSSQREIDLMQELEEKFR